MKKACVIGSPIGHSRSPLIHNYWLKHYGLEGAYEKREVKPEDLRSFIQSLAAQGYVGCNVTIPHKEAAVSLVDEPDAIVRKTGALNTIFREDGKWKATSTDGEGFYQNLTAAIPGFALAGQSVALLGAGGSARSVIEKLLREGVGEILLFNRNSARAEDLAAVFGRKVRPMVMDRFGIESKSIGLLVNTTPLGMKGQPPLQIDLSALPQHAVVADLVYVPLETDLLRQAKARGQRAVGGLGMLLHQAVIGFEKWFGVRPAVTPELYNLVARDVDPNFTP